MMKSIGEILKQARHQQNLTLHDISTLTKIRLDYLKAIEKNEFTKLPSAAFVKGFIQNYAKAVHLNPQTALAIFRRDFDQNQQGKIIPRGLTQPISPRSSSFWNPKTTTAILSLIIIVFVATYIIFQLVFFSSGPEITLSSPKEALVTSGMVEVKGKVTKDATITVNKQPVATNLEGAFSTTLNLTPGPHTILIEAQSGNGKKSSLQKDIVVESQGQ
jgi:cytoskeletal protein RodZ